MMANKSKLIEEIIKLQHQVSHTMGRRMPDVWLNLDLTISQLKSLFFIDFEGSTNLKKLAAALGVTPPDVTGIVSRLVENGLVSRGENPDDRRALVIKVTDKGKTLLEKLRESHISHEFTMLSRLGVEDLCSFARGLRALAQAVEGNKRKHEDEYHRS